MHWRSSIRSIRRGHKQHPYKIITTARHLRRGGADKPGGREGCWMGLLRQPANSHVQNTDLMKRGHNSPMRSAAYGVRHRQEPRDLPP